MVDLKVRLHHMTSNATPRNFAIMAPKLCNIFQGIQCRQLAAVKNKSTKWYWFADSNTSLGQSAKWQHYQFTKTPNVLCGRMHAGLLRHQNHTNKVHRPLFLGYVYFVSVALVCQNFVRLELKLKFFQKNWHNLNRIIYSKRCFNGVHHNCSWTDIFKSCHL